MTTKKLHSTHQCNVKRHRPIHVTLLTARRREDEVSKYNTGSPSIPLVHTPTPPADKKTLTSDR